MTRSSRGAKATSSSGQSSTSFPKARRYGLHEAVDTEELLRVCSTIAQRGPTVIFAWQQPQDQMSALGQKQTSLGRESMSALPPKADISHRKQHVR